MAATAPQWTEIARGVAAIVQIAAIVVAGIWAYYKFAKGRTFKPRAELDIQASVVEGDGRKAISLSASFRNTGLVYIDLRPPEDRDAIRIAEVWATDAATPGVNPDWGEELILGTLFEGHEGCDVGETLLDHLLLPVPVKSKASGRSWLAYRINITVLSPKRRGSLGRKPWTATTLLTDALTEYEGFEEANKGRTEDLASGR